MSYSFDQSLSQYLGRSDILGITDHPISVVCFMRQDSTLYNSNIWAFSDTDGDSYYRFKVRDTAPDIRCWARNSGSGNTFDSPDTLSADSWEHIAVVYASDTSKTCYLNASAGTELTDTQTFPSGLDNLTIGRVLCSFVPDEYYDGYLCEIAIYTTALTQEDVTLLSKGISPLLIKRQYLRAYWPLIRNAYDYSGNGYHLTTYNSPTIAPHPSNIWYPDSAIIVPNQANGTTTNRSPIISGEGGFAVTKTYTVKPSGNILVGLGSFSLTTPTVTNTRDIGLIPDREIDAEVPGWVRTADKHDPRFNQHTPVVIDAHGAGSSSIESKPAKEIVDATANFKSSSVFHWFEHIHLLPRTVQELGNIISQQTINIDLYNADRYNPITINSITNNLGTGITVVGVPATPFNLNPETGIDAQIIVSPTGDLNINASYTFHASDGNDYTIYITGSRIVLFPIRPEAPLKEKLVFDTKILTSISGKEQRIANVKYPRSKFDMTIRSNRRMMEMLLFDRQSKIVATPAWHEPSYLSADITAGDTEITVNTTDYANFYVGGYAVIYRDEYTYEALEITAITATSLTFDTEISQDFVTEGTEVMPLMIAYYNHKVSAAKDPYNEQTFQLELTVTATENDIADASAWSTHNSRVFLDGPNLLQGALAETLERKVLVLDNITGLFEEYSQWGRNKRNSVKGFKTDSRQELWELRQLFHYLKGKQISFYIPTFSKDLIPNQTLIASSSAFTMDNIGYTVNARGATPKDYFRMHLSDGTILTRSIVAYAELSKAEEQLTVDTVWPYDIEPDDIERIEFLELVRLNVDEITIIHYNALGQSKCFVPIIEVFDDD